MRLKNYDVLEKGDLPESCLEDCTSQGNCTENVEYWKNKLNFNVEPSAGFNYLVKECGLPAEDFIEKDGDYSEDKINLYILWLACHDIKENEMFNLGI